jgi:DNA-binding IscR family transcriptional regulator
MRALEGPLANVRGHRPETLAYEGSARALAELWIAVRASLRTVLETTTVADLARGDLPQQVRALTADPEAWSSH